MLFNAIPRTSRFLLLNCTVISIYIYYNIDNIKNNLDYTLTLTVSCMLTTIMVIPTFHG